MSEKLGRCCSLDLTIRSGKCLKIIPGSSHARWLEQRSASSHGCIVYTDCIIRNISLEKLIHIIAAFSQNEYYNLRLAF